MNESPEMTKAIEDQRLEFNFRRDTLLVAQDPMGRNGPKLDKFLKFNDFDIDYNFECRDLWSKITRNVPK